MSNFQHVPNGPVSPIELSLQPAMSRRSSVSTMSTKSIDLEEPEQPGRFIDDSLDEPLKPRGRGTGTDMITDNSPSLLSWWWWWEISSILLSVTCLSLIVAMLLR